MENYDDIINLPHFTSKKHKRMSLMSRAVQFAPFAALTGLDEQVDETARHVDTKHVLTDDEKALLDMNMQILRDNIDFRPFVTLVYFIADEKKSGGSYKKIYGKVRRIEEAEGILIFENDKRIPLSDVVLINFNNHNQL